MLRNRLLLQKQDRLCQLERDLEVIDHNEAVPLFLGSQREDQNDDRRKLMLEIDQALADYGEFDASNGSELHADESADEFATRVHTMHRHPKSNHRAVQSLKNWLDGNACIARAETEYLTRGDELFRLLPQTEGAVYWRDSLIEDGLICCLRVLRKVSLPHLEQRCLRLVTYR
jgi:hypothetical protein